MEKLQNVPRLTLSIIFGILVEIKNNNNVANNVELFKELYYVISDAKGVKIGSKIVSDFKNCKTNHIGVSDLRTDVFITGFKNRIHNHKNNVLTAMREFIDKNISENQLNWLVSALIELVCGDQTISSEEQFEVTQNLTEAKKDLPNLKSVNVDIFLLSVICYIINNRVENIEGRQTFEAWFKQKKRSETYKLNHTIDINNAIDIERYEITDDMLIEEEPVMEDSIAKEKKHNESTTSDNTSQKEEKLSTVSSIYNQQATVINNFNQSSIQYSEAKRVLSPNDYFHLFVVGQESYNGSRFTLPKERALEATSFSISNKFKEFTFDDTEELIQLPAIFLADQNSGFAPDDPEDVRKHLAYLGKIEEMSISPYAKGGASFRYQLTHSLKISKLKEICESLDIHPYELSRTHWAIKKIKLLEVLERHHVELTEIKN